MEYPLSHGCFNGIEFFGGRALRRTIQICFVLFCLAVSHAPAQSEFLTKTPWNGDWMSTTKDQMVHGEDYRGYPGPMVKMFLALGYGPQNPAVDFELLTLVQRDAPNWFGNCNGWSSAAILYDEPQSLVVNGVKLFGAEMKALISGVWKNHVLTRVSEEAGGGMLPHSFEQVLDTYIANNQPLIFDVTIGTESWNYPVAGFERSTRDSGDYTIVETTVYYTTTLSLAQADIDRSDVILWPQPYTYRISKTTGEYEWVGLSVDDHPHSAWFPISPYISGRWDRIANRSLNTGLIEQLNEMAADEAALVDLFEPNNLQVEATSFENNLVLGSLPEGDEDWFRVDLASGEADSYQFEVYDGPEVDIRVVTPEGLSIFEANQTKNESITLPRGITGSFLIHVKPFVPEVSIPENKPEPVFFKLLREEHRSWYAVPEAGGMTENKLRVINPDEEETTLSQASTKSLAALGSTAVQGIEAGELYRVPKRSIWSVDGKTSDYTWKKYYREKPGHQPYRIPHFTFRNGWETRLELRASKDDDVWLSVFDATGDLLQRVLLDRQTLTGASSLSTLLNGNARTNGAWFALDTTIQNYLSGVVVFRHSSGIFAPYDVEGHPRHGEMVVQDILNPEDGWIGISLLNVSGIENEVMYRVVDEENDIVVNGIWTLQPGERLLGTPQSLTGIETVGPEFELMISSQYELETLAIRREYAPNHTYAYHLPSSIIDTRETSYVTIADDPANQLFIFDNVFNSRTNRLSFRAYAEDGTYLGLVRVGESAIRAFQNRQITMAEVLGHEDLAEIEQPIAYFKITSQRSYLPTELLLREGKSGAMYVRPERIYDDP